MTNSPYIPEGVRRFKMGINRFGRPLAGGIDRVDVILMEDLPALHAAWLEEAKERLPRRVAEMSAAPWIATTDYNRGRQEEREHWLAALTALGPKEEKE